MAGKKDKEMAFEKAMEQLEEIVADMEAERMPLEDLVVNYEKGTRLLEICQSRIEDAQKRIEMIAKQAGGGARLKNFDAEGDRGALAAADKGSVPAAEIEFKEGEGDEIQLL
ncbi:MAG: exodeoxyribonuclease VII small subunit [Verrucomicrobiales bacterium]